MPEPEVYPKLYLYRRIVQAKLFIDRHYAEQVDLTQIADEAYFSKFHFTRLFKQAYGKTPHQYLTRVRLDHAKQLLATGESVAGVCYNVGFESSTSFTSLFKRYIGITPSVYQLHEIQKQVQFNDNPLYAVPNCFAETYGWKNSNIR